MNGRIVYLNQFSRVCCVSLFHARERVHVVRHIADATRRYDVYSIRDISDVPPARTDRRARESKLHLVQRFAINYAVCKRVRMRGV